MYIVHYPRMVPKQYSASSIALKSALQKASHRNYTIIHISSLKLHEFSRAHWMRAREESRTCASALHVCMWLCRSVVVWVSGWVGLRVYWRGGE